MNKNDSGFGVLGLLIIVVAAGMIAGMSWLFIGLQKNNASTEDQSGTLAQVASPQKQKPAKQEPSATEGPAVYESKDLGFRFEYPKEWGEATINALSKVENCAQTIASSGTKITGEKYKISFSQNKEKSINFITKDFAFNQYTPCITLGGQSVGPHNYEYAQGKGFYSNAGSEYIAGSDIYECLLSNYYLYAIKPLATHKINGVSVVLHSQPNPNYGQHCQESEEINLLDKVRGTLNDEDKWFMSTFTVL